MRTLQTTYYGVGRNKPVVKTTRGSKLNECLPNICRHMTDNDYGAIVADVTDLETGELLLVVTYHIGEDLKVGFRQNVKHPVCVVI